MMKQTHAKNTGRKAGKLRDKRLESYIFAAKTDPKPNKEGINMDIFEAKPKRKAPRKSVRHQWDPVI